MARRKRAPVRPPEEAPDIRAILEQFDNLPVDQLISRCHEIAARPHVRADPELSVLLGVLGGRLAAQTDRVERLARLCSTIAPLN